MGFCFLSFVHHMREVCFLDIHSTINPPSNLTAE